jgi:hypothetical protein
MGKLQSLKIVFSKALGRDFEKTNRLEMRVSHRPCNRLVTVRASILGRLANLCLSLGWKIGLNLCKKCMMLCRALWLGPFQGGALEKGNGHVKGGPEKTKPAKPKLLRVVCGADAKPAPRGG